MLFSICLCNWILSNLFEINKYKLAFEYKKNDDKQENPHRQHLKQKNRNFLIVTTLDFWKRYFRDHNCIGNYFYLLKSTKSTKTTSQKCWRNIIWADFFGHPYWSNGIKTCLGSPVTEKTLDRNFNEVTEIFVNILIDLEQSKSFSDDEVMESVSNLDIQFDKQLKNKVRNIDLSNQQKFEQIPEIRNFVTEVSCLKGYFCYKSVFNLSKKVLTEISVI